MRYTRSVKCYFPHLTQEKKDGIKEVLYETHRVIGWAIDKHEAAIKMGMKKAELLLAKNLSEFSSWLTARAKKNCFAEAHALVSGTFKSSKALNKPYGTPSHKFGRTLLSCTNVKIQIDPKLKNYDLLVELYSIDSRKRSKIAIPLKRHKIFNKWAVKGKLCSSVIVTDKYIQFSFDISEPKKKKGDVIGVDPGAKHLYTDDTGRHYGSELYTLLSKLKRKVRLSKAWWRVREEIKSYIDLHTKKLPYETLKYLILEDNRGIKRKSKLRGRLSKNMRSFLAGWAVGRIHDRVERLCEEHGVSLRRVSSWYNSTTCPDCGHCEKANRVSQEEFICVSCGTIRNADVVGAINSLARYALGPYGAECKPLFVTRHPEYHAHV